DPEEAQRRRKNVSKEAGFYGAMDGASKFVKGDAIAGIIIMLINVIGGLVIGIMQMGMPWGQALQTFTLLTIGDGIVTQVPALVISVGTGLIVTRSASDGNLSTEVLGQLTAFPKTILLVVCALAGVLLLPGIPVMPALALIAFWTGVAFWAKRGVAAPEPEAAADTVDPAVAKGSEDAYGLLAIEAIEVQVGAQLVAMVGGDDSILMERIATFRKQYAQESGLVLPNVRFRDSAKLAPAAYEINVYGVNAARGEILTDHILAIHAGGERKKLRGVETREPTYGLPAIWITEDEKETARLAKFTLVDPATVFITHLCEVLRFQSATLLSRKETERLLGRVREQHPGLVEEVVPTMLAVGDVQKVLQNLLREKVSIRNLEAVMETLADHAKHTKDCAALTELVRQRLGAMICQSLAGNASLLQVLTFAPDVEHQLLQNVRAAENNGTLFMEPQFADQVMLKLSQAAEKMMKNNLLPVILCAPDLRRHIRLLSERLIPHLRVIAMNEVPGTLELRAYGTVAL
ncbi:MAG TPA: flagellar biosynthesis protein FlhA, partial [Burkholderiaceae bacterium]